MMTNLDNSEIAGNIDTSEPKPVVKQDEPEIGSTMDCGDPLADKPTNKPTEHKTSLGDSIKPPASVQDTMEAEPNEDKPDEDKPDEDKPNEDKPNEDKPDEDKEPGVQDILGNGKLVKRIIQAGNGVRPMAGEKITVTFSLELDNGTVIDKDDTLTFVLGDGDYLQAFDLCCSLMEVGELACLTTAANYAYGEIGRKPDIPPNACLVYNIHLVKNHGRVDYEKITLEERLEEADKKRERGNFHYSRTEYAGAINSYSKAITVLEAQGQTVNRSPEDLQRAVDMKVKCYNNLAASQLKVEIYDAAIKSCNAVLNVQPDNVKALFRKGKCFSAMGEPTPAITALKKALKYDPESKIIHSELSRLSNCQKMQEERERAMYARMMGSDSPKKHKKSLKSFNSWAWAAGVAGAAAAISVGFTAYRYFHM